MIDDAYGIASCNPRGRDVTFASLADCPHSGTIVPAKEVERGLRPKVVVDVFGNWSDSDSTGGDFGEGSTHTSRSPDGERAVCSHGGDETLIARISTCSLLCAVAEAGWLKVLGLF